MDKKIIDEISKLVKERCAELLSNPSNSAFDSDSFTAGYLFAIFDQAIFKKED
jgi:hypothetical protein